jgi:hypothetical protein
MNERGILTSAFPWIGRLFEIVPNPGLGGHDLPDTFDKHFELVGDSAVCPEFRPNRNQQFNVVNDIPFELSQSAKAGLFEKVGIVPVSL